MDYRDNKNIDKIDAGLMWNLSSKCNLNCEYCVSADYLKENKLENIDIPPLLETLKKTGKTFCIQLTGGGEPFLVPNFLEACQALTKDHYISLSTNLTSPKVKEFAEIIDPKRVLLIAASAQIKEMEKKNLTDCYINNFLLFKNKGFNIRSVVVAYPSLLSEADKYKRFFSDRGINIEYNNFRGKYQGKDYPAAYTKEEREKLSLHPEIHYQYGKVCNAGYNAATVKPNGEISPCLKINLDLGNIYTGIHLRKNLMYCPLKFCECPVNIYSQDLLSKAIQQEGAFPKKIFLEKQKRTLANYFDFVLGQIGIVLKKYSPWLYTALKKIYH